MQEPHRNRFILSKSEVLTFLKLISVQCYNTAIFSENMCGLNSCWRKFKSCSTVVQFFFNCGPYKLFVLRKLEGEFLFCLRVWLNTFVGYYRFTDKWSNVDNITPPPTSQCSVFPDWNWYRFYIRCANPLRTGGHSLYRWFAAMLLLRCHEAWTP